MKEDLFVMWLTRIDTLGIKKQRLLLNSFSSAEEIFKAPKKLLETVPGISQLNVSKIIDKQHEKYLSLYEKELDEHFTRYISFNNPEYPQLLREIIDAPLGLYIIGTMPDSSKTFISLIGSRRCTEYGLSVSHKISKDLASQNFVIVSGMARGIDSMAHKGALDAGGETVAVLGCGTDICYPPENRMLREQIIQNGCVISEYPPKTKPIASNFPSRNRIISGLSRGLIVVEAALKSGTLITVEQALEQGRDVMAVPGSIISRFSQGTNELIKQGAALVSNFEDVINYLGIDRQPINLYNSNSTELNLSPDESSVYKLVASKEIHFDEIVSKISAQPQTVSYILTLLEMKGLIQKLPGQRYSGVI